MLDPDHPEVERSLREASIQLEDFHAKLYNDFPALRGSLAISGMLIGRGLGSFIANGLTDAQIVVQVLGLAAQIRRSLDKAQVSA
jgi:hypothetical protein